ncbi:MAG: flavodoxin family protein [Planctomycetota bacterium]
MAGSRVLVVFYSRTGTTDKVAQALAAELGADTEEVIDMKRRRGPLGFAASIKDALLKKTTRIKETKHAPSAFNLVLVGTPVWAGSVAPAIRRYLEQNRDGLTRPVFFLTTASTGIEHTFEQMGEICGKEPLATFSLLTREVKKGEHRDKVRAFAEHVRHELLDPPPGENA